MLRVEKYRGPKHGHILEARWQAFEVGYSSGVHAAHGIVNSVFYGIQRARIRGYTCPIIPSHDGAYWV